MRLNKFLAMRTSLSRRGADDAIATGNVFVNGSSADLGKRVEQGDIVEFDGQKYLYDDTDPTTTTVVLLNKPVDYVCSRDGQGSPTIYELLPDDLQNLEIAGRLDKDSSGLVVLTNNGDLHYKLTHPKFSKEKIYEVSLDHRLAPADETQITKTGVNIGDERFSRMGLSKYGEGYKDWKVRLEEGRNRQIRRTFEALGYKVDRLHRTTLDAYELSDLESGAHKVLA